MELPPFPSLEGLQARLAATREWAYRLIRLKPCPTATNLARLALDDLNEAERLLEQPAVGDKPHTLRAVDVCLEVAQWRLRGADQIIDDDAR